MWSYNCLSTNGKSHCKRKEKGKVIYSGNTSDDISIEKFSILQSKCIFLILFILFDQRYIWINKLWCDEITIAITSEPSRQGIHNQIERSAFIFACIVFFLIWRELGKFNKTKLARRRATANCIANSSTSEFGLQTILAFLMSLYITGFIPSNWNIQRNIQNVYFTWIFNLCCEILFIF